MTGTDPVHPGRLALGLVALAAERVAAERGAAEGVAEEGAAERVAAEAARPGSEALATAVGLVQLTTANAARTARRAAGPPGRLAARGMRWAAGLPLVRGPVARAKYRINRTATTARDRGRVAVDAGRAEAVAFVRSSVDDGIAWAQNAVVPRVVDGLVPHLVDSVVPRIIDGVLPEVRARVLPVVIDDLTTDPRVRDMVVEQSKGMLEEAAEQVRDTTSSADDRVEAAFRRLFGSRGAPSGGAPSGG